MTKQASVWAPYANTVDLVVGGRRSPMQRSGPDTFVCDKSPAHGEDYGFSLNGGPIIPDPRSPWQPSGVHGLSRGYDHSLFKWSTETWHTRPLFSTVLYELHVGTFTADGTFQAAIERLDHLRALGVTTIELMPVAQFPGARGWGYDGVDLFAVHSQYGGPDGLKSFVDACHVRDLTVMLDVVYNHVGPEGNYLDQFGPYINTRYRSPYGAAFNLDGPQSSPVRGFLIDNARWWVTNFRLDGLRLDAVNDILDTSANHFLLDLTRGSDHSKRPWVAAFRSLQKRATTPDLFYPRRPADTAFTPRPRMISTMHFTHIFPASDLVPTKTSAHYPN